MDHLQPNTEHMMLHNFETLLKNIQDFRVKDMRQILTVLRETPVNESQSQMFLPKYGMTLGEFCVFYLIK
jgi:hypothetical protein